MKEFKINDYLSLKLRNGKTIIYVKDEEFLICKRLMLSFPINTEDQIRVGSMDEAIAT